MHLDDGNQGALVDLDAVIVVDILLLILNVLLRLVLDVVLLVQIFLLLFVRADHQLSPVLIEVLQAPLVEVLRVVLLRRKRRYLSLQVPLHILKGRHVLIRLPHAVFKVEALLVLAELPHVS